MAKTKKNLEPQRLAADSGLLPPTIPLPDDIEFLEEAEPASDYATERQRVHAALRKSIEEIGAAPKINTEIRTDTASSVGLRKTDTLSGNFSKMYSGLTDNPFSTASQGNIPNYQYRAQPARNNMDGSLERVPDCPGFWVLIEVEGLNPLNTRILHVTYRGDALQFRYIDELDDVYMSVKKARRGPDVVYLFLWEPEEL